MKVCDMVHVHDAMKMNRKSWGIDASLVYAELLLRPRVGGYKTMLGY